MERHVGLSFLSVGTEVSDCVCYLLIISNFSAIIRCLGFTSTAEFIYNS